MSPQPLPATMPALVCHGPHDYRLEELPTPVAGPGEVVIEVEACGVCAGDAKCFGGAPLFWGDALREGYVQAPITPGHEFIGTVVALGEGAGARHSLALGDRAIAEQIVPCWKCRFCRRGQYWMCQVNTIFGFRRAAPGGMARYLKFPAGALCHRVPREIPVRSAAMIEPLSCSFHAVQRAGIEFGDCVVVAGCGPLGLGMVGAARLKSPGLLIAIDLSDQRLAVARQLGADLTLNPSRDDVIARVRELTEGYGCDVYLEASGHPAAVEQGLHAIRKLGTFVEFSVMAENVSVDWTIIGDSKELDIRGAHLGPYCYPLAIDAIARGLIDVSPIVSHSLPLERFAEAFELVHDGRDSLKVLLTP